MSLRRRESASTGGLGQGRLIVCIILRSYKCAVMPMEPILSEQWLGGFVGGRWGQLIFLKEEPHLYKSISKFKHV